MSGRFLSLLLLLPLAAGAQTMQIDAAPVAGTLRVSADDAPASATFDVRADRESGIAGCVGFVDPTAPDAVVEWGGGDLRIWGRSAFDGTLLVATPDGDWACNDDADGTAPAVELTGAEAGRYAVWLGSFSASPFETDATLYAGAPPPPPVLDASARPLAGVIEAAGGFEAAQGAIEVAITAGGPDAASALDLSGGSGAMFCTGYIAAAQPTAAVDFSASGGTGTLTLGASSVDDDLVMVVQGPDGEVVCDDDTNGPDPAVAIDDPQSGVYTAWVGTFRALAEPVPATFIVSETAPETFDDFGFDDFDGGDFSSDPFSEGTYTPLDLSLAPQTSMALGADVTTSATAVTVQPAIPNPVQGDLCTGYIENAPTAGLTIAGEGPIAITAASDTDLVLVIQTPSGGWFCSDDADGLNPGVQIDDPEAGTYKVWAGTFGAFGADDAVDVEVAATRGELVVSSGGDFGGFGPNVEPQSSGTYDGTEIRPGSAAATVDALPASVAVQAGGPILNPVDGEACSGFVSERPTAELTAGGRLVIEAEPDDDTDLTLVLLTSEGAWICSDDADGMSPRIEVDDAPEGTHAVWVGTFSRRTELPGATLSVSGGN